MKYLESLQSTGSLRQEYLVRRHTYITPLVFLKLVKEHFVAQDDLLALPARDALQACQYCQCEQYIRIEENSSHEKAD